MDNTTNMEWGRELSGKLQDKWPKTADGEFERPAFLAHCASTDMADELMVNMLDAYGVPCVRLYPNDGRLGKVILGMSGIGADIYVPESMLEDAKELCKGAPDNENV